MIFAGMFVAMCAMLPLALFHLSAPAMALAVIGGAAVGLVAVWIVCLILVFTLFKDR